MLDNRKMLLAATVLAGMLAIAPAFAQTPGFNQTIPDQILTPDTVETRIGTLNFVDGVPTTETTKLVYDNLDFLRGVEVFLNFIPAASVESMRLGNVHMGAKVSSQAVIMDNLLDSNPLFLTGNTDTVYCSVILDLETDGPTVVEVPKGTGPGTVNDAFFRFVVDMGGPGPDRGDGGKYLIVSADYKGELPKDKSEGGEYYIARSPSYHNWLILRGFLVDGKPDAASKMFREELKIYPLAKKDNPPAMEFFNGSKISYNTIHANNFEFFKELDHVIQKEPIDFIDPELRGLAASIGIRKGTPFAPDERMTAILTESVAVANATARAVSFRNRDPRNAIYPGSQWQNMFGSADYRFLDDGGKGGRNLDSRTMFYYGYTVNTPAMVAKIPGRGSQYAMSFADSTGEAFDGAKTYKLNVPANAPAKDFWSTVVYDPQTRSELQTGQPFPGRNSKRDKLIANSDGSVDIYFGPKASEGQNANWIQTVPGKGWFAIFRLYGPLEPWFDKTWKVGEIELVK